MFLFSALLGFGQQADKAPVNMSLQQAIEAGLKNRYDVQSKKYNLTLSQSEVAKSKKEWLPEINATGNMRYSPQIQATYIPGGFFSEDPSLVALGAKSMAVFGLEINQTIFKPGIATDTKIAKSKAALAQEKNKQDENTVKEQIVFAYLNVILKDLQRKIAATEQQRFKDYADLAEGKHRLGSMIETDLLKARLDFENAKVETQKANQNYDLALSNMKYQMNVDQATDLLLTDTLNSPQLTQLKEVGDSKAVERTEIRQLMLRQETMKLELNKTKQAALPSLALYGNYSKQFTYTNLDYTLGKWWSTFNYVGLQLKIPIAGNIKNYNNIEENRIKLQQAESDLKQRVADVNYEVLKANTEVSNAEQNMKVTLGNYELSKTIYESQKQQYGLGAKPYSELLETNRSLTMAEQNYVKAVYEYLVASVNYQKAIGRY